VTTPCKVVAIVLAAGRSTRFVRNKLIEPIDGEAMVARVVGVAIASGADPIIVVTGFEATRVAAVLQGLNVKVVRNPAYDEGLSTSLQVGIRAVPPESDGALILLGDMPGVQARDIGMLLARFAVAGREAICLPVKDGRRGNPVLWGAAYFPEMMAISGDVGAKELLARHADKVCEVPAESNGIFADVDTPNDLDAMKMERGQSGLP
jgi:molybdenum cofactor cytidylyltransferase